MSNLFIPTKIRVGFQKRDDTFTGKLAYVIYYDEKGKIRKETSWKSWCDSKIEALELDNVPRSGYMLNKGVKRDGYWGSANEYVRIHDPRDFEFEIKIPNLMHMLMHVDLSKREIMEDCVFAWAGDRLMLIPTNSVEYQESLNYTAKQSNKVSTKDLKVGLKYAKKKGNDNQDLMYIGHFNFLEVGSYKHALQVDKGKRHIFWDGSSFVFPAVNTLSHNTTDEIDPNYASILEKFQLSMNASKVTRMEIKPGELKRARRYSSAGYLYKLNDQHQIIVASINFGYSEKDSGYADSLPQFNYKYAWYENNGFDIEDAAYKRGHDESRAAGLTNDDYRYEYDKNRYDYAYRNRAPAHDTPTKESQQFHSHHVTSHAYVDEYSRNRTGYSLKDINGVLKGMGYGNLYLITENGGRIPYHIEY